MATIAAGLVPTTTRERAVAAHLEIVAPTEARLNSWSAVWISGNKSQTNQYFQKGREADSIPETEAIAMPES